MRHVIKEIALIAMTVVFLAGCSTSATNTVTSLNISTDANANISPSANKDINPPGTSATTATIAFDGLSGNDSRFKIYDESGFSVSSKAGSWEVMTGYGHPAPAIIFKRSADESTSEGEVEITAGGSVFSFRSVDLYSSVTPIPYTIKGYRNSELVFTISDTVPNTYGNFAQVTNPKAAASIDALTINLSNPATPGVANPVGLDNIVLGR